MFKQGIVGVAILVWRFFTFYLFLPIGAAMSIVNTLRENGRRAREKLAAKRQPRPKRSRAIRNRPKHRQLNRRRPNRRNLHKPPHRVDCGAVIYRAYANVHA